MHNNAATAELKRCKQHWIT